LLAAHEDWTSACEAKRAERVFISGSERPDESGILVDRNIGSVLMRHFAILLSTFVLAAFVVSGTATSQTTSPDKSMSKPTMAQKRAVKEQKEADKEKKEADCKKQAADQKLGLMKRRAFVKDCMKK
jgi:hypothetical protein